MILRVYMQGALALRSAFNKIVGIIVPVDLKVGCAFFVTTAYYCQVFVVIWRCFIIEIFGIKNVPRSSGGILLFDNFVCRFFHSVLSTNKK